MRGAATAFYGGAQIPARPGMVREVARERAKQGLEAWQRGRGRGAGDQELLLHGEEVGIQRFF